MVVKLKAIILFVKRSWYTVHLFKITFEICTNYILEKKRYLHNSKLATLK